MALTNTHRHTFTLRGECHQAEQQVTCRQLSEVTHVKYVTGSLGEGCGGGGRRWKIRMGPDIDLSPRHLDTLATRQSVEMLDIPRLESNPPITPSVCSVPGDVPAGCPLHLPEYYVLLDDMLRKIIPCKSLRSRKASAKLQNGQEQSRF